MSGELYGEAMAARRTDLAGLTQSEYLALLAIVNRCKPKSRIASVGFEEIRDAIGFVEDDRPGERCSVSTGRRAIAALRDYGLVAVIQRGHKPRGKPALAPVYRVADELKLVSPQKLVSSQVTQAHDGSLCHEAPKLVSQDPEACVTAPPLTRDAPALHVSTSHVSTSHGETPSSLRSDGAESPRSQAHAASTEKIDPPDRYALYKQAQWIVTHHVDYRLRDRYTRSAFDTAVQDALTRGLDKNTIIAAISEWNPTAVRDWDERLPSRCLKTFEEMLRCLVVTRPVTTGATSRRAEERSR